MGNLHPPGLPQEQLEEPQELQDYEIISLVEEPTVDPSKTGNKPKKLKAVEVLGFEVGRGLKKRIVNPDDVYKLAAIGSTDKEISRWFGVDEQTLRYNFKGILEKGREDLKQSLRMAQLKLALSGNAVMLIWLGKNILGQSDNGITNDTNQPLPWTDEE
jgi:aminopeptidase C